MSDYWMGDVRDKDDSPTDQICNRCGNHFISGAKRPKCKKCGKTSMLSGWLVPEELKKRKLA